MKWALLTLGILTPVVAIAAPSEFDSSKIPFNAITLQPLVDYDSDLANAWSGVGISRGIQTPARLDDLTLRNFSCYFVIPIGTSIDNARFFEGVDSGRRLKASTKLTASGFNFLDYSGDGASVFAHEVDFYFQIVGGASAGDPEAYDLVLTCPAYGETLVDTFVSSSYNVFTADLGAIVEDLNHRLAGVLKIEFPNN